MVKTKRHQQTVVGIMSFIKQIEKLKTELRHSWTSNIKRQESVAEHLWMCSMLAILLFEEMETKVNQLEVLKMVAVHDLGEALVGDIPEFKIADRQNKIELERAAFHQLTKVIDDKKVAREIVDLWEKFEKRNTPEAKLAYSIDKFEVLLQHIHADMETWDEGDFSITPYYTESTFDFDPFARIFKDIINETIMKKIEKANKLHLVKKEDLKKWKGKK